MVYIIGSLNNPTIIEVANKLHEAGIEEFAQWMCSGPEADQHWKHYGKQRGWSYTEILKSAFVQTAFNFDFDHMKKADSCVLVMPAGKSAHCELGWFIGSGRKGYILFDGEPDRPDLMPPNLATGIFFNIEDLIKELKNVPPADKLSKIGPPNTWICPTCHQYSSIGCCACYQRGIGNSGGNWTLTRSERLAILEEQDKLC